MGRQASVLCHSAAPGSAVDGARRVIDWEFGGDGFQCLATGRGKVRQGDCCCATGTSGTEEKTGQRKSRVEERSRGEGE
jgi:hypothetical protein